MPDYTDAARARLAMAYEACEVAEIARLAVPIGAQELRAQPGPVDADEGAADPAASALAEGARVLAAARRYFETVVVFARLAGASWQVVGESVDLPEQIARERFEPAEEGFHQRLKAPIQLDSTTPGELGSTIPGQWWRTYLTREPAEAAHDLDDWVLRHLDGEADPGPTPVSGNLV